MPVKKTKANTQTVMSEHEKENAEIHAQAMGELNVGGEIDELTPDSTQEVAGENNVVGVGETSPADNGGVVGATVDSFIPKNSGPVDVDGVSFDPLIHSVTHDGTPSKTKSGKWRKKTGKKTVEQKKEEVKSSQSKFLEPPPATTLAMLLTTVQVASITLMNVVGKEWEFTNAEKDTLADVYARYVHYRGWDEFMTPEMVVIGVTLSVLGPRITPKILALFATKKKKGVFNAHVNRRENPVGKNDNGESNSQTNTVGTENTFGGLG